MAKEDVSKIYGKPNFALIVAMFAMGIVVLLLLGWLFMHFDPLHLRMGNGHPRTGMMLILQSVSLFR